MQYLVCDGTSVSGNQRILNLLAVKSGTGKLCIGLT